MRIALRHPGFWLGFLFVLAVSAPLFATGVLGGSGPAAHAAGGRSSERSRLSIDRRASRGGARGGTNLSARQRLATGRATARPEGTPRLPWVSDTELAAAVQAVEAHTGALVGAAVRPLSLGRVHTAGSLQSGPGWSTMKVPVILARYRLAVERGEPQASLEARVQAAITESDNEAAMSMFEDIERAQGGLQGASRYVQEGLRAAGDAVTTVNTVPPADGFSTFGQTLWSLRQGTRFYGALDDGCLTPAQGTQRILGYMGRVVGYERWGMGQAAFPGSVSVRFKGGWGPDLAGRYLVRQFGIVQDAAGRGFVVGLIAKPADGSFQSGVRVIDRLADAVAASTHVRLAPRPSAC